LIQARLAATQADVRLKRVVGIPLADPLTLAEPRMASSPAATGGGAMVRQTSGGDDLVGQALSDRAEIRITREQVKAETYGLGAARAGYLPVVAARADYGFSGNEPNGSARTGLIGGRLDLPIFNGGLTLGQVKEAKGRRAAAQSRYDDTRIQV